MRKQGYDLSFGIMLISGSGDLNPAGATADRVLDTEGREKVLVMFSFKVF